MQIWWPRLFSGLLHYIFLIVGSYKSHWNDKCNRSRTEESCMFCFITWLKLRHWKIPPDITTEETREHWQRHAWRSTEICSAAERWFHRYELFPDTSFPLFPPLGEKTEEGVHCLREQDVHSWKEGNVELVRQHTVKEEFREMKSEWSILIW